jgi:hypothetical protein
MNVPGAVLAGLLLAAATASLAPQRAAAVPPTSTSFPFSDSQTDTALCGFPVELRFAGTFTERSFYDTDGHLVRVDLHSTDVATAVVTSGATVTGHEVVDIRVDIRDQTETKTGVPLHFSGLLIDAGRIVVDANGEVTAISGDHRALAGDVGKFCAALA